MLHLLLVNTDKVNVIIKYDMTATNAVADNKYTSVVLGTMHSDILMLSIKIW